MKLCLLALCILHGCSSAGLRSAMLNVRAVHVHKFTEDPTVAAIGKSLLSSAVEDVGKAEARIVPVDTPKSQLKQIMEHSKGLPSAIKRLEKTVDKNILHHGGDKISSSQLKKDVVMSLDVDKITMKKLDLNGDGFLDSHELRVQMHKLLPTVEKFEEVQAKNLQRDDLNSLFTSMDTNQDNALEFGEVYGNHMMSPRMASFIKDEHFRFDLSDGNHDHKLSHSEFFQFQNPRFLRPRSKYYRLLAREEMKANGVNVYKAGTMITWDQYKNGLMHESGHSNPFGFSMINKRKAAAYTGASMSNLLRKMKGYWRILQQGQNGLTLSQLTLFIRTEMQDDLIYRTIQKIIKVADDNGDGKLSLEEVMANAKRFDSSAKSFFQDKDQLVRKISVCKRKGRSNGICVNRPKHTRRSNSDGP